MKPHFKPWQILRVQEKDYAYFGEAMSMETPDQTVMVRRVPGHSGTLEEQPINKLTIVNAPGSPKIKYVHYAIVAGVGSFPIDMLRRDYAAPLNFTLHERRSGLRAQVDPSFGFEKDELVIARASHIRQASSVWTVERWRTFSWDVRPLKTEEIGAVNV